MGSKGAELIIAFCLTFIAFVIVIVLIIQTVAGHESKVPDSCTPDDSSQDVSFKGRMVLAGVGALLSVVVLVVALVFCQVRLSCRACGWSHFKAKLSSLGVGDIAGGCIGLASCLGFILVVVLVIQTFVAGDDRSSDAWKNNPECEPDVNVTDVPATNAPAPPSTPAATPAPVTNPPPTVAPMTDVPATSSPPSNSPAEDGSSSGFSSFRARIILAGLAAAVLFVVLLLGCWRLRAGSWSQLKAEMAALKNTRHFHAQKKEAPESIRRPVPADISCDPGWGKEEELLHTQQQTSLKKTTGDAKSSNDIDMDIL